MRNLNPRTNALYALYFGAFLVTSEIGIEQFLSALPEGVLWLARGLQIVGSLLVIVGLADLIRGARQRAKAPPEDFLDVITTAATRTHAYMREALAHALAGLLIILVASLYAALYWTTTLSATPRGGYYLVVLIVAFGGLFIAWLVPFLAIKREVDRINTLALKEHA